MVLGVALVALVVALVVVGWEGQGEGEERTGRMHIAFGCRHLLLVQADTACEGLLLAAVVAVAVAVACRAPRQGIREGPPSLEPFPALSRELLPLVALKWEEQGG